MTSIEQAREVIRWCRQLSKFSEDRNAITRTFLSKPMRDVHTALAAWMARVGMTVRVDAVGNIRLFDLWSVDASDGHGSPPSK